MPHDWLYVLRTVWRPFLLSRLWVALFVYAGHATMPYRQPIEGGWIGVDNWWLNPWTTYDSQHFLHIAAQGYTPETTPFFPFYPLLLRAFGPHAISMAGWGIFLSNVAFLVALAFLYKLTRRDYNRHTATVAVWLLAFFPTTAVFSAVYTDALYLALLLGAWLAVRRDKWALAAIPALLASLTRNAGAVLSVALVCQWWQQKKQMTPQPHILALACALMPALGLIGVQYYLHATFGGMPGVSAHGAYGREWQAPWIPILNEFASLRAGAFDVVTIGNLAATLGALFLLLRYRRQQPIGYSVLLCGVLAMQLCFGRNSPPFTNTSLRLLSTTFPFIQLLALSLLPLTENRQRLVLTAAGYLLVCALFSFMFGQRQFVSG